MSAVWDSLFGKDGLCIEVIDSCRINYDGRSGWLVVDEGAVIGGYTDVYFYPDDAPKEKIRLLGGSLFNSKRKECIVKFNQIKKKYGIENKKKKDGNCKDDIVDQVEGVVGNQIEGFKNNNNINEKNEKENGQVIV